MKPNEKMDELVETKLTKTEAIDLVIEEMRDEVLVQRHSVDEELKRLRGSITVKELEPAFKEFNIEVGTPGRHSEGFSVTLSTGRIGIGRFPVAVQVKLTQINDLYKRQEELGKQIHEFAENKSRVRNAILKTMLEGSDNGKQFLQLLTALRLKAAPKMEAARKLLSEKSR